MFQSEKVGEPSTTGQVGAERRSLVARPWYRWVTYLVANAAFTSGVLVSSVGIVIPEIMRDLTIEADRAGLVIGAYSYTYALMQIPGGIMADRAGPRRTMSLFLLIGASGIILFSQAPTFSLALVGRVLTALGVGVLYVNQIKVLRGWFKADEFATAMGIGSSINSIGSLVASPLLALLVEEFGWRSSFTGVGFLNMGFAVVCWMAIRDRNPYSKDSVEEGQSASPSIGVLQSLRIVFGNKQFIYIFLIGSLSFGGLMGIFFSWGLPFLMQGYDLSRINAALIMTVSSIFILFGGPLWGHISDKRLKARKPVLLFGLIGSTIAIIPIAFVAEQISVTIIVVSFAFMGFSLSGLLLAYTMVNELFPASIAGVAAAGLNMGPYIGSGIYQALAGYMLGTPASYAADGTPVYTLLAYQSVFWPGVIAGLVAIVIITRVKETMKTGQVAESQSDEMLRQATENQGN